MLLVISVVLSLFCISVFVAYEVFDLGVSFGARTFINTLKGTVCLKSVHLGQYLEFKPHSLMGYEIKQDGVKSESRNITRTIVKLNSTVVQILLCG
jgi:hypothetical protein